MIQIFAMTVLLYGALGSAGATAQPVKSSKQTKRYYIDVHHLGAGKVTAKDVAIAHSKDLAVEKKYGVRFLEYWVDEDRGDVYCLSAAASPSQVNKTHAAAHGLLPDDIYSVVPGQASAPGKVTAKDVANAHRKDLAVQEQYGVNFINYWVNEKKGTVLCLSQAPDSTAVSKTHSHAHGLVPVWVKKVVKGQ